MKCPKCGGEIPFYDLKPNCRHCGVNILYYTQDYLLERDAKRAELEGAVARMVVAKIKAVYIGSVFAVLRMIGVICAICALLVPFCSVRFILPFYDEKFSVSIMGLVDSVTGGLLFALPDYCKGSYFADSARAALLMSGVFALILLADLVMAAVWILAAVSPKKTTKIMKFTSLTAALISLTAQILSLVLNSGTGEFTVYATGFGALVSAVLHIALFFINSKMLKKGVEPQYREFDPKRKELLKKVRKGETDLDELTLPVFESDEEREERMKTLLDNPEEADFDAAFGKEDTE